MLEYRISPTEWADLHRWDRAYLRYALVMRGHMADEDRRRREREAKAAQDIQRAMPAVQRRPRG
jgi:hypothetical protein